MRELTLGNLEILGAMLKVYKVNSPTNPPLFQAPRLKPPLFITALILKKPIINGMFRSQINKYDPTLP